jgi:DNA-binding PadR family transcriptional regulator
VSLSGLSVSDWAVLALLAEQPAHGFYLVTHFGKSGELGVVWTIQRPQVYRALEHLQTRELITPLREESGDAGPPRTVFEVTECGKAALAQWLSTPVKHLRDARSALLLRLIFLQRAGRDTTALLTAQREVLKELKERLEAHLLQAEGSVSLTLQWRLEMTLAALNFIEQQLLVADAG